MKKRDYIFIFVFLSGMLFTVFQYMVITEEETPHRKIELAKKVKNNTDSGDGNNTSTDEEISGSDNCMNGFFENMSFDFYHTVSSRAYYSKTVFYSHLTGKVSTPPPKI